MFPILAITFLAYFAYKDYKTSTTNTKELIPLILICIGFILLFGNILLSTTIATAFLFIMLGFQKLKITYLGDTLVIPCVAFIYPEPFVLLIALTIGFILSAINKKKLVPFLPFFFIGLLFVILTNLLI